MPTFMLAQSIGGGVHAFFYIGVFRPNMLYIKKVVFILMNKCFGGETLANS